MSAVRGQGQQWTPANKHRRLAWVLHDSPFLSGDKELTESSTCRIVAGTISPRPECKDWRSMCSSS